MKKIVTAMVMVMGCFVAACASSADPQPGSESESEGAASAPRDSVSGQSMTPDTTVYECSITGNWWATRDICLAHCAGGTCFACGLSCQN